MIRSLFLVTVFLLSVVAPPVSMAAAADPQTSGADPAAEDVEGVRETERESDDADEEIADISVEVVGRREGLLSISPAPGETLVEVDVQDIADAGADYVADAIELTPSVFIRHQGARYENRLSIRGAAPRLVLLDGVPIAREGYTGLGGGAGGAEAGFAGRILYTLPAEIIERIDVIRSVGTIVYGPTAGTGAVINIVTKEPEEGESLNASASYGSYSRHRSQVSAGVGDGRLGYLVHGGLDYAGSHLELGEKRFADAFGKLVYTQPDGSKLLLDYFWLEGRRTLDLSEDFSIVPPRYWQIDPWQEEFANLVYSKPLAEDTTLDLVYYQRARDFETNLYTSDAFATVKQNWLESQDDLGVDLRYSIRKQDGRMTRAGLQWSKIMSDTLQTQFIGPGGPFPRPRITLTDKSRRTGSAFYQATRPLRRDLRVSVGARYDNPSDCDAALTYSAGIDYDASPKTTWHVHVGTGKENPLPTDGDIEQDIVPAEASTLAAELGVTTRPDSRSSLSVNFFWSETNDGQVLYNDPPGAIGPTAWISKAEDIRQRGAEVVYDRKVSENTSWFANYMLLREDVTNENEPLMPGPLYPTIAEPPTHVAAAGVRANVNGTRIAFSAKYSADYMALNRLMKTAAPVESYLTFDLKLTRSFGTGRLSLFIENLLDADYETMPAFPRPGRNYLAEYSVAF